MPKEVPQAKPASSISSLSLDADTWARIVESLHLTPQQSRVVELILKGQCDKQIAAQLRLSVPTVRTHLTRIFRRNGVSDRVELILMAFAVAYESWRTQAVHRQR